MFLNTVKSFLTVCKYTFHSTFLFVMIRSSASEYSVVLFLRPPSTSLPQCVFCENHGKSSAHRIQSVTAKVSK